MPIMSIEGLHEQFFTNEDAYALNAEQFTSSTW